LPVESQEQLVERLAARSHLGGAGNLRLAQTQERLTQVQATWTEHTQKFTTAIEALVTTPTQE